MTRKNILASASPRRSSLLKEWGLNFEVKTCDTDETIKYKKPSLIVKDISYKKAIAVASNEKNALVIAADTIVVLKGRIIGKPKDKKESEKILRELNASRHKVYTGVAIIDTLSKKKSIFYDCAEIKMRKLSETQLSRLFGKHMDKAGAYAVQDKDDKFVEKIRGDYYTVVGLPKIKLFKELLKFGIKLKSV